MDRYFNLQVKTLCPRVRGESAVRVRVQSGRQAQGAGPRQPRCGGRGRGGGGQAGGVHPRPRRRYCAVQN